MKALTLTQPWASLVALRAKRVETRSWSTIYRGPLAIHAAKRHGPSMKLADYEIERDSSGLLLRGPVAWPYRLPLGAVVATCHLTAVVGTESVTVSEAHDAWGPYLRADGVLFIGPREAEFGDYSPGRFAWLLTDVLPIRRPVTAIGRLGLWDWYPGTPAIAQTVKP